LRPKSGLHTRNKRASQATLRPEPIFLSKIDGFSIPFDNLILQSDTARMNPERTAPRSGDEAEWCKTPYTNLIRYKPSGVYFARFRVQGKLFRRSLKTEHISVALLRLADLEKSERQKAQSALAVASGKMTFGDALAVFKARAENNPSLKPRTKEYCAYRIAALLKSWPGLAERDVSRITSAECLDWSVKNASQNSSSSHNYTVSILRRVFAVAIESGVDIPTVSRWLGHKDGGALAMKTYGHLRNEHSQAMAQKVKF